MAVEVARNPDSFDCARCAHRHCSESLAAPGRPRWIIKGLGYELPLRACPKPQVTPASAEFISLYSHYRQGYLLTAGGVEDQPVRFLQAMSLIDSLVQTNDEQS